MDLTRFIKLHDDDNRSYILDLGTIVYINHDGDIHTNQYEYSTNHSIEKIQEMISELGYTEDIFLYLHDKENNPVLVSLGFVNAFDVQNNAPYTSVYFAVNDVNDIEVIESIDSIYKKIQNYKQTCNDKNSYQPLITSQVNTEIDSKQLSVNKYAVAQEYIRKNTNIYCRKIN